MDAYQTNALSMYCDYDYNTFFCFSDDVHFRILFCIIGSCIIMVFVLLSMYYDYDDVQWSRLSTTSVPIGRWWTCVLLRFPEVKRSEGAQLVVLNFGHGWMLHDG